MKLAVCDRQTSNYSQISKKKKKKLINQKLQKHVGISTVIFIYLGFIYLHLIIIIIVAHDDMQNVEKFGAKFRTYKSGIKEQIFI